MSFYQRPITFNHTLVYGGTALTNFPVVFGGTYTWIATVANGGRVLNSSGIDIYFSSDSAATHLLTFERVVYNPTNGKCEFWVLLPSLSTAVDTVYYVNYGDPSVTTDLSNPTAVWDTNYVAVYHFGDGTTLNSNDSTSYANHGTNHGATASASLLSSGQGAAHFIQASSQYIDCGSPAAFNLTGPLTLEVCLQANSNDTNVAYIGKGYAGANGYDARTDSSWDLGWALRNGGAEVSRYQGGIGLYGTALAFTYDGSTGIFYYNNSGGNNFSGPFTNSWAGAVGGNASVPLRLGAFSDLSRYFDGDLDEVRISKIVRSAGWLETNAVQLGLPGTFPNISYTVGPETIVATPLTLNCGPLPAATLGVPYSSTLVVGGGLTPYTFALISGSLPPGLTLNTSTGVISGTPTTAGSYTFGIKVTDTASATAQCTAMVLGVSTGGSNIYVLRDSKLTDDDYGQVYPYYVTYFAPTFDQEQQMDLGGGRKLFSYLSAFVEAGKYLTAGCNLTISFYGDTLANQWALSVLRSIPSLATFDTECAGGSAMSQRIAVKFASSPASGTDNGFSLQKIVLFVKKDVHLPVRGSVR